MALPPKNTGIVPTPRSPGGTAPVKATPPGMARRAATPAGSKGMGRSMPMYAEGGKVKGGAKPKAGVKAKC